MDSREMRPETPPPGVARPQGARPTRNQAARPSEARAGVARNGVARPETALARPVRTRARLTRRGRIVVAALITACVVLVAALAWLAGTARAEAAGSGSPASAVYHSLRSVVVQPGESLWTIATQADPAGDPRAVMQEIIDINALHGTSVQPGERLWLPRG
jgi:LysM domain-containing protein